VCSPQEGHRKKDMKFKVADKEWLWWYANGKNFNNDHSGEFGAKHGEGNQIYLNYHC